MMSESNLLPCPFCEGEALLRERYISGVANTKHYRRECRHCKATFANWYRSIKKANEAWNRRAQSESARQRALQTGLCPMCEDCPDGCPIETPYDSRNSPENSPLTLSEIYETDNEPLYFHCTVGHWSLNGWHIVKAINYDGITFKDIQLDNNEGHIESLFNYGITWVAYRAKPAVTE